MKCSYCGHELSDGAEFCDKCGMILGFADEKKNKSDGADSEFTQNIFQTLDFDDSELDIAAMELPVSDYEETAEVSYNIPEYVSSPEDEVASGEEKSEEPGIQDDIPTIEADFEAPEYTPVPDVVISAKRASDVIKESNHVRKEGRKKKKQNKKINAETYDIESLSLEENPEEIEKQNEEEFKEAVKAPEIIPIIPIVADASEKVAAEEEPVTEEIPEAVEEPIAEEIPEVVEEPIAEEIPEAVEEPVAEEIPEAVEEPIAEEIPEAVEEPVAEEIPEVDEEPVAEEIPEYIAEPEEVIEPIEEQPQVIGLFEDIGSASDDEEYEEEEEYEDITPVDDSTAKTKKSKKGIVIAALIFILCVLCAGAYALKDYIPVMAPTEATSQEESTVPSTEETTEEETTEEETTGETSEEETTEGDVTTEEATDADETTEATTEEPTGENEVVPTTKPTTTKPSTTKPSTTKPATTKPATTRPATTKPATTKPATTKPATTKPATTKPNTTTDPYGINEVTVKKPSSYIKSYTGYVTAEGLNMRSKPSTGSERVLFLSKGADVKVLAKENGFLYVYSNRYGVSGWVSASYISTSRPTETTSKLYTGTVQPDVKATSKVMHTTYSLNIRKGPSTSYPSVQIIATGYPVKVIGSKSGVSGWVYVTDLTYGVSGWVSTAYLK